MKRAHKYRFHPTPERADLLNRTFGGIRLVWNKTLAERNRRYTDEGVSTLSVDTATWLTAWKQDPELEFLREVSNVPLRQALRRQQIASNNFFAKRARYPRFTSVEEEISPLPPVDAQVGMDAGLTHLLTLSTGEKITKVPTRLVRENQTLAIEDLTVRNLVKNHSPARAISDASGRELRGMLAYKSAWYGRRLAAVDRWFPSSKLCSARGCGHVNGSMPSNVRSWSCPACESLHDRDVKAAKNILAAGLVER
ncbi:RNA-guided endonuclease TnpB family protein [Nonomuraea diastatica]|uniref:RNA-guided endonuclease TnpB family protein n=1 Tax=Nonomuraea diastatica TaxID=1848329 RepID=UPI00140AAED7|nr:RNA-guided endonuclease TnpB family protein [Nonomuraea diastatica]